MLLSATLLVVLAACSSHAPGGGLVPQTTERSRAAAVNPATSCAVVPSSLGTSFDTFLGGAAPVAGASSTDAWAVGATSQTFHHFDGTTWHSVPAPKIPNQSSYQIIFYGFVTPIASHDVWVAGQGVDSTGLNRTAFFLHWNGRTWSYVPSAPKLTNQYGIAAMAGDASNDVWAIAVTTEVAPAPSVQLERWDGSKWSLVVSQSYVLGFIDAGEGLVVLGPNDVWMYLPTPLNSLIGHWNGSILATTGLPPLNDTLPINGNFSGTADNDLWYDSNINNEPSTPYIVHRSSSWGPYNTSNVTGYTLHGVVDFRPGYALMLADDPSRNGSLLVYNGYVRWRPTVSPWPSGTSNLVSGQIVKGTTSFWAAFSIGNTSQVALIKCPSTPPSPL